MGNKTISRVRGMHDILPEEIVAWQHLEKTAALCFRAYGYQEIRTPLVELRSLFERQLGEESDIVKKEMYSFTDKDKADDLVLRPEATVSTIRALLSSGTYREGLVRVWYQGPMFRRERPQKGRRRQFFQIGAEAVGSKEATVEVEQIIMLRRLWCALGIENKLTLDINNLGSSKERVEYTKRLRHYFTPHQFSFDETEKKRLIDNPLRLLDSKNPFIQKLAAEAPKLSEVLREESQQHFDRVKKGLEQAGISYNERLDLVRGLDYYNLTVYEWCPKNDDRRQNTICGGGRYDGLAEKIGDVVLPGCGFALGMERLLELLDEVTQNQSLPFDCYLCSEGESANTWADSIAEKCRNLGSDVIRHVGKEKLGKQIQKAEKMNIPLVLVIGEEEVKNKSVTIKNLRTGKKERIEKEDLDDKLPPLLKENKARKECKDYSV